MSRIITTSILIAIAVALALSGCAAPLDVDVPRKETALTAAPKVKPTSIVTDVQTADGVYQFVYTPKFEFDTTVTPARVWMDFTMGVVPDSVMPLIQAFRFQLDTFPADGLINSISGNSAQMSYDDGVVGYTTFNCDLITNTASIVVAEHDRVPGEPRKFDITMYLIANKDKRFPVKQEQLLGVIQLTL